MRFCCLLLSMLITAAAAADQTEMLKNLRRAIPELRETMVSKTPLAGIYEIVHNGTVFYADEKGDFILQGSLYDVAAKRDLTEEARKVIRRKLMRTIDDERFIRFSTTDVKHKVVVFTDVTCGYCRKFHSHMRELNELGIEVDYLLTPFLGEKATADATSVWCSKDRAAALDRAKKGRKIAEKTCDTPLDDNIAVSRTLAVRGTPAIFLADGTMINGYVQPLELLLRLEGGG